MEITYKTLSSQGGRPENQDYAGQTKTDLGYLFVVCDGMGGTNGGRLASETAFKTVIDEFKTSKTDPINSLINAIKTANYTIHEKSQKDENLQGMGTTIVAFLLTNTKFYVAHAGDSRFYHFRKNNLLFRTTDHSVVAERLKKGIITSDEEARLAKDRNKILRALGTNQEIEIDINEIDNYKLGDRFLLCTDGIWEPYSEKNLIEKICKSETVDNVVNQLIQDINLEANQKGGGHDNLTAILVELGSNNKVKVTNKKEDFMKSKILSISLIILLVVAIGYIAINRIKYGDFYKAMEESNSSTIEEFNLKVKQQKQNIDELKIEIAQKDTSIMQLEKQIKNVKANFKLKSDNVSTFLKEYKIEYKGIVGEKPLNALDSINKILK